MTTVKWSDGEAAWEQALNDYAKTLAESDPQSAAELLGGAAGGADAARAAANIALLSDAADQLATLTSDPDVFVRAADLSSQCIGRVFIALDASLRSRHRAAGRARRGRVGRPAGSDSHENS